MSRILLGALVTATALAASGCTSANRIVGHEIKQSGRWYGELGLTGHLNEITVLSPSRLTKLSIIGDANKINIDDGVTLGKIEIWGENNVVSIPQHLVVRVNQVGGNSRVVRRAPGAPLVEPPPATAQPFPPPALIEAEELTRPPEEKAAGQTPTPAEAEDIPE